MMLLYTTIYFIGFIVDIVLYLHGAFYDMRFKPRDRHAQSEIVGALLLIVITVAAAGALAVYISYKQTDLQKQDAINTKRANENIVIIKIVPTWDPVNGRWGQLTFTLASLHYDSSSLTMLRVNDVPITNIHVVRQVGGISDYVIGSRPIPLKAFEQIDVVADLDDDFGSGVTVTILKTDLIKIGVSTELRNTFDGVFFPPRCAHEREPGSAAS